MAAWLDALYARRKAKYEKRRAGASDERPPSDEALKRGRARRHANQKHERERRAERNTKIGRDGTRRCRAHGKRWYAKAGQADQARLDAIRGGRSDPTVEVYWCAVSAGWHLGTPGRYRSYGRLVEEAERSMRLASETTPAAS